jgi:electron transfer flavoprotein alpha subunit
MESTPCLVIGHGGVQPQDASELLELDTTMGGAVAHEALATWIRNRKPDALVLPAAPAAIRLAAELAVQLELPVIADCVAWKHDAQDRLMFVVSTAGGMALMEVEASMVPALVLMPQREFDVNLAAVAASTAAEVTRLPCSHSGETAGIELASVAPIAPQDMSLAEANVIVSGGRGLGKPEAFELLRELAALLGGHVGASRVATDLGWIERDHLVGMSGSTVRPALYFAIGISGAPHHLMGMREASTIVALNADASAPMMQLASHGFVGDLHEVIPRVIERLGAMRASA